MCGFAGIVDAGGRALPVDALRAAGLALAHRGPDAAGAVSWSFSPWPDRPAIAAALVHRRLSVLDPSDAGAQPMGAWAKPGLPPALCKPWQVEQADLALAYNGEVYNFRAVVHDLVARLGFERRSTCDSEALLAAYAAWGPAAFERFNGMWACALLDRRPEAPAPVLLCRDRFGKKPLLWTWHDGRLVFASELRALLPLARAVGLDPALDLAAVEHLLRLGVTLDPHTIFAGVHALPAGHLLRLTPDGPVLERWYTPPPPAAPARPAADLRQALDAAVADRLGADVPLGLFLSGGVDSAIVAYHARRHLATVRSYSIGFPGQPRFDETAHARAAAAALGTQHTVFEVTPADLHALVPAVLDHLAEPFADSSLLPTWLLSRLTRRHVTVALSGDGGDELFCGYHRYRAYGAAGRWSARAGAALLALLPAGKRSALADAARKARRFRRGVRLADPVARHLAWISAAWPADLLRPEARRRLAEPDADLAVAVYRRAAEGITPTLPSAAPLDLALRLDAAVGLPADMLRKVDLASMAHGLEVRCPFLDPRVVHLAQALPADVLAPAGRLKGLLVDAYRDVLPATTWRRRKQGFEVPIGAWLAGPLRELFWATVSPANVARLGLFERGAIERLHADQAAGRDEHGQLLWTLLVLHGWAERWL